MENDLEKLNSMREAIQRKIKAQEFTMRPKIYFSLQIASLLVVAIAILVTTILIANFIAFSIRINNGNALLGVGPHGWSAFVAFFPWTLLVLDIALMVALEWMLRKFRFGYKIPVLYLLGGLLLASVFIGFGIDRGTPLNDFLYDNHGHLPRGVDDLYGQARHDLSPDDDGLCLCTITAIDGSTLTAIDTRDGSTTVNVVLPPNDPRATTTGLVVGETVLIAGEKDDGAIHADDVRSGVDAGHGRHGPGPH